MLILGAGASGICILQCVLLKELKQGIVCEKDSWWHRCGAEVAGDPDTFRLAWPNGIVTAVVLYDEFQALLCWICTGRT